MRSPRDFDFLAQAIFEKVHQPVSASTLKRFWGYLPRYNSTRPSTLDLLSRFLGYRDWEHFLLTLSEEQEAPPAPHTSLLTRGWGGIFSPSCSLL